MVEHQLPKLRRRVRFPSSAFFMPGKLYLMAFWAFFIFIWDTNGTIFKLQLQRYPLRAACPCPVKGCHAISEQSFVIDPFSFRQEGTEPPEASRLPKTVHPFRFHPANSPGGHSQPVANLLECLPVLIPRPNYFPLSLWQLVHHSP